MPVLFEILVHEEVANSHIQCRFTTDFKRFGQADVIREIAQIIQIDVEDSNFGRKTVGQVSSGNRLTGKRAVIVGRTRQRCSIQCTISEEAQKLARDILIAGF